MHELLHPHYIYKGDIYPFRYAWIQDFQDTDVESQRDVFEALWLVSRLKSLALVLPIAGDYIFIISTQRQSWEGRHSSAAQETDCCHEASRALTFRLLYIEHGRCYLRICCQVNKFVYFARCSNIFKAWAFLAWFSIGSLTRLRTIGFSEGNEPFRFRDVAWEVIVTVVEEHSAPSRKDSY